MKTILRYPFKIAGKIEIEMPGDARVLTVQAHRGVPCMWAEVHLGNDAEVRDFRIYEAMDEMEIGLVYVGSFQMNKLVLHLYEKVR